MLLGHTKLESTVRCLGIEVDDALVLSEQIDLKPKLPRRNKISTPPQSVTRQCPLWVEIRAEYFRVRVLSGVQWFWGLIAAVSFAISVHAAMAVPFSLRTFQALEGILKAFTHPRSSIYPVMVIVS